MVRISPTEVHLSDPQNYEKIYAIGTKFLKDPGYYSPIDVALKTPIILTVINQDVHKIRRAALNPFFSRRSVLHLEDIVWTKVRKLCRSIDSTLDSNTGAVFDFHRAVRALTVDIITEYAYARCWNQLDKEDFGSGYQDAIRAIQTIFIWFQTFPIVLPIFDVVPDWVRNMLFDSLKRWDESLAVSTYPRNNSLTGTVDEASNSRAFRISVTLSRRFARKSHWVSSLGDGPSFTT